MDVELILFWKQVRLWSLRAECAVGAVVQELRQILSVWEDTLSPKLKRQDSERLEGVSRAGEEYDRMVRQFDPGSPTGGRERTEGSVFAQILCEILWCLAVVGIASWPFVIPTLLVTHSGACTASSIGPDEGPISAFHWGPLGSRRCRSSYRLLSSSSARGNRASRMPRRNRRGNRSFDERRTPAELFVSVHSI